MRRRVGEVRSGEVMGIFLTALRLGLTSFGGPIAHLGYFQREYVERKRWVSTETYAEYLALVQFLPGPSSSQMGILIGMTRARLAGGIAAWLGFTLPSAVALTIFALLVGQSDLSHAAWLHGLLVVAVAVVAQAIWSMLRTLAPDRPRATLAVLAAMIALIWPTALTQVAIIVGGALCGWRLLSESRESTATQAPLPQPLGRRAALGALAVLAALLVALPLLHRLFPHSWLATFDQLFRTGSLVFGGGHVVLPLLQVEIGSHGGISSAQLVAGYGAAQAVPGPLFTFAAYLGALLPPGGWLGAALATVAIFLPSFLLLIGVLPFWQLLRQRGAFQAALRGVNATVAGLLMAAFYQPIWVSAISGPREAALALAAGLLLIIWKVPPWVVVVASVVASALLF